jgi:hypothetical protein
MKLTRRRIAGPTRSGVETVRREFAVIVMRYGNHRERGGVGAFAPELTC